MTFGVVGGLIDSRSAVGVYICQSGHYGDA